MRTAWMLPPRPELTRAYAKDIKAICDYLVGKCWGRRPNGPSNGSVWISPNLPFDRRD